MHEPIFGHIDIYFIIVLTSCTYCMVKQIIPVFTGRGPDDADLCQLVKYNKNGREIIPDFLAICDRDAVKYCIFKQWICDDEQDCFDNQDETDWYVLTKFEHPLVSVCGLIQ